MKQNVTTKFKRSKKAGSDKTQKVSYEEAAKKVIASGVPAELEEQYTEKEVEFTPALEELMAAMSEPVDELTKEDYNNAQAIFEASDEEPDGESESEEPEEKVVNSIVKPKYKDKYIENAKASGAKGKAARRSNWDWLSQMLATYCLSDKGKIDIGAFTDVLDANGVDHSRWLNRTKGWEGRFRMTGRVALQRKVADSGRLVWPDGTELVVPVDFVEKFKSKA